MSDPLSEVVQRLRPSAVFANILSGKGNWAVRYSEYGQPSFCIMLEGNCLLSVDGEPTRQLNAGDFVLLPTTPAFTLSSLIPAPAVHLDPHQVAGGLAEVRYGDAKGEAELRALGGSFRFDGLAPGLLASLLPTVVHVQGSSRLAQLVWMVREECTGQRPGSDFMLSRLVDLLLVEAMRAATTAEAPPGLLRGLGDERLAPALRQVHAGIEQPWSVERMAKAAALSRSAFFERFRRTLGVAPMEYLLAWRMERAKGLLREGGLSVAQVAERVGYGSASTFSVAFSRYVGAPPGQYGRRP
ncbi:AraC family transcriptional regulator [Pseudomonas entomophila]|uniref:AraC family transcriptional regulator n=1 Tax=Pseudomonas entomophila TaxID=312306 RepID=UPI0023D81C77|nr:AraC family transcriptional regulator [Pseudomonas entomophila]MDF0730421.1 AraC family transcriptional regulator [Pseudomonas entomophila]